MKKKEEEKRSAVITSYHTLGTVLENNGSNNWNGGVKCKNKKVFIGTGAIKFMLDYPDWNKITLITPADKEENIIFYTKKCGFKIDGTEMDGNVKVVHFSMER